MTKTLDNILELLGGESAVASALGCGPPAVSNWKTRGVPKGRWVDLVMLAERGGVHVTLADVRDANTLIMAPATETV